MGYRMEIISGAGASGTNLREETWTEERFSIQSYVPSFGPRTFYWARPNVFGIPSYYPEKALSKRNTNLEVLYDRKTGDIHEPGDLKYYLHHPGDIAGYTSTPLPSRKIRNIIPISDDVDSDFYGGYLTDRHFQLSLDIVPVSTTEVTVVANRGRMNFKKKKITGQSVPTGEGSYKDFPLYYGDNSDSAVTGVYTGIRRITVPNNYQSTIFRVPFQSSAGDNYNIKNDEDFPEGFTKPQFMAALRFGSSTDNIIPIGNPVIDKEIPSLPAAEKDELLYVFYKNFKEADLEIGLTQNYPYKYGDRDYEEYFLTLNSVDGKKYKNNKDYIVLVLGSFEFRSGVITKKDGPFNFYFNPGNSILTKFGIKEISGEF